MDKSLDDVLDLTVPEDAAAYWIIERDKGADLDQSEDFVRWLAASERHALAWKQTLTLWNSFDGAKDPLLDAMRRDALSARPAISPSTAWLKVAAILALVIVSTAVGWRILGLNPSDTGPIQLVSRDAMPTFVADAAGPSTFTLDDGSIVTLAPNSALAVQFSQKTRAVRLLRGHAFFNVAHDPRRPFSTDLGTSTVMDRGTEFDALIDGEKISITLISGGLSVASPGHDIAVLKPGQKIETGVGKPIRVTAVDIEAALAWRTGYLEFSDVALEGAISEINRYGAPAVRIADPSVRAIKVSGRFRAGNPGRFARALAEMYPLRVIERSDGGIDIAAR